jgi:hypothetical protein
MFRRETPPETPRVDDLKDSREREVKALRLAIDILVDQVDYLRAQVAGQAFISARTPGANPSALPLMRDGTAPHMSEEEEELRALHESGHISAHELRELEAELGLHLDALPDE